MNFYKIAASATTIFLLGTTYSAAQNTACMASPCCTKDHMLPGYNASCRIEVEKCTDVFIIGRFTYWEPIQEQMPLGIVSNNSQTLDLVNGKEVDLNFKYKPGFKVGIGVNFDYDEWETLLQYTWFRGTHHVSRSLDPNNNTTTLFPAWIIPDFLDPQYQFGSEKWKLRMDFIDWEIARSYHVGRKLCMRPFLGLRGAIIDQRLNVKYINTNASFYAIWPSTFINQKSDSWGIGPRVGFSSKWELGCGWRLYGNAEFDILYTRYDLKSVQKTDQTVANRYIVRNNNTNYVKTHADLGIGLGWGTYFGCNRYHIDLSADYGFQVFFNQNMFRNYINEQAIAKSFLPHGNLYIHGLTASLRFDF